MPRTFEDLTGKRYGRLVVLSIGERKNRSIRWSCHCDCGEQTVVQASHLKAGHTTSCGCAQRDRMRELKGLDLVGKRYGRLMVLAKEEAENRYVRWKCICDCGGEALVMSAHLRSGHTTSCGCVQREAVRLNFTRHGMRNTRVYRIWNAMIQRCTDKKASNYHNYGGRGITIDPRWLESVENFYADMGDPPTSKHTLDRRDSNGGYNKDNCRWATMTERQNNKRSCVFLTFMGRTQTITQWSRELGIPPMTITARLRQDRPIEEVLSTTPLYRK